MAWTHGTRQQRLTEARTDIAGIRSAHFARETGTLVLVVDGEAQGLDTEGGRWYTICDDHGQIICHETLALAKAHSSDPLGWCEVCMGTDTTWEPDDEEVVP